MGMADPNEDDKRDEILGNMLNMRPDPKQPKPEKKARKKRNSTK